MSSLGSGFGLMLRSVSKSSRLSHCLTLEVLESIVRVFAFLSDETFSFVQYVESVVEEEHLTRLAHHSALPLGHDRTLQTRSCS